MPRDAAYDRVRAVARRSFGPAVALLRGDLTSLAAELSEGEVVDAVLAVSTDGRGWWDEGLGAATDRRLLLIARGGAVRALGWDEVHGVDIGPRRAVIRTAGGDLPTSCPPRSWELRVVADRAAGLGRAGPLRDRFDATLGRRAWTYADVLVRVLDELGPDEPVAGFAVSAGANGVVVLTDGRIGLVPSSWRRASRWVAFDDVAAVRIDEGDLLLETGGRHVRWVGLEPAALLPGIGAGVAAGAGVPLENGEEDDGDDDFCECCADDGAGGWPVPPDDAVARRLDAFATDLRTRLDGVATVEREHPGWVAVRPASPVAAAVTWGDSGLALQVEIDWARAGVLHLDRADVADLESAVRAVVTGRVGQRRGRAVLHLDDGRVVQLGDGRRRRPAYPAYAHDAAERLHRLSAE